MGKGNWERRAERENAKREAARAKKAARGNPKKASAESVIRNILKKDDKYGVNSCNIRAWVEPEGVHTPLCGLWFRSEACKSKRCNASHEVSIAMLRNVSPSTTEAQEKITEPYVECINLQDISPNMMARVKIIAVDDTCVFDYAHPELWAQWSKSRLDQQSAGKSLPTVVESDTEIRHESDAVEVCLEDAMVSCSIDCKSSSNKTTGICHFDFLNPSLVSHIMRYLSNSDVCALCSCCHSLRNIIRKDDNIRGRKREHMASIAKVLVKKKKEEKKRKLKVHMRKSLIRKMGLPVVVIVSLSVPRM